MVLLRLEAMPALDDAVEELSVELE